MNSLSQKTEAWDNNIQNTVIDGYLISMKGWIFPPKRKIISDFQQKTSFCRFQRYTYIKSAFCQYVESIPHYSIECEK